MLDFPLRSERALKDDSNLPAPGVSKSICIIEEHYVNHVFSVQFIEFLDIL